MVSRRREGRRGGVAKFTEISVPLDSPEEEALGDYVADLRGLLSGLRQEWLQRLNAADDDDALSVSRLRKLQMDTPEFVGVEIIRLIRIAETALNNNDNAAFTMLGYDLAETTLAARLEFGELGADIAAAREQRVGQREGGRQRWASEGPAREAEWRRWQTCADAIWASRAALSKTAVAALVVSKLKLDVTTEAVRKRIEKPGRT